MGNDSYPSHVTRTVVDSLTSKTAAEKKADKLAARLIAPGAAASAATLLLTKSLTETLSVQLALAGPCATVPAASTAVAAAWANAAPNQVLFEGGAHLERVAGVDRICFDKTGTLTGDLPEVAKIIPRTPLDCAATHSFNGACGAMPQHPSCCQDPRAIGCFEREN